jgi:hypothetical protein
MVVGPMPQRLPPGAAEQLDIAEGTIAVAYLLPEPLGRPPQARRTLIADESPLKTQMRIDLDDELRLHWVRQAPEGQPADIDVGIGPLRGARQLLIVCIWSPTRMAMEVSDRDKPRKIVRRST